MKVVSQFGDSIRSCISHFSFLYIMRSTSNAAGLILFNFDAT